MLRKISALTLVFLLALCSLQAQKQVRLTVAFYNLENLFDTIDGENNDADFLPDGKNQWTPDKYKQKLHKHGLRYQPDWLEARTRYPRGL